MQAEFSLDALESDYFPLWDSAQAGRVRSQPKVVETLAQGENNPCVQNCAVADSHPQGSHRGGLA
jgi:hypothetical protein